MMHSIHSTKQTTNPIRLSSKCVMRFVANFSLHAEHKRAQQQQQDGLFSHRKYCFPFDICAHNCIKKNMEYVWIRCSNLEAMNNIFSIIHCAIIFIFFVWALFFFLFSSFRRQAAKAPIWFVRQVCLFGVDLHLFYNVILASSSLHIRDESF